MQLRHAFLFAAAPIAIATAAAPALPQDRLAQQISAQERQQGTAANGEITAEYGGAFPGRQANYTEMVGRKIATQSGLSSDPRAFDVTLLNSPVSNAFAIPGGYVYLTRNLMALMNDEAELAAVMGHEVAHVAARHSKKRQSNATRNSILGVLGQVLVGAVAGNSGIGQVLNQGIGTASQLATLGFSRSQETQADDYAVTYLTRAGYDPYALSTMLQSLAAETQLEARLSGDARGTPVWASTHPDPASRVRRAQQQAAAKRATGVRNRDTFLAAIDGLMYGDDPKQGVIEGQDFLYPTGRVAFSAPRGYKMTNGARSVTIAGSGGQAQFSTASFNGDLDSYVAGVLAGLAGDASGRASIPQGSVRRTSVNGLPAAYTTVRATANNQAVDVTVFAYQTGNNQAYHFVTLTPAGRGAGVFEPLFGSFRRMSDAQAAAVKPRYLRVVTVKRGDTVRSLAGRMAYDDYRMERFQVLNRLDANAALQPGDKVKIVTW